MTTGPEEAAAEAPSAGAVAVPKAGDAGAAARAGDTGAAAGTGDTGAAARACDTGVAADGKGRTLGPERAWDIAAILVSWFGGLLLIGEAATVRGLTDDEVFLHFMAGCLFSLALWWRRGRPVPVAVFLLVASVITDAAGLAALVALATVVAHRRGRVIAVLTLLHFVAGMIYAALFPDPNVPRLANVLLTVAILATTIALGVASRSRRELIDSLRERTVRAEAEARLRADRLRVLERERIAREMHDSLAHRISMVSLHAGALQIRPDLDPAEVARAAATIRDSAHQALEDLREILGVLRAGPGDRLRPQPDLSHLEELVGDARKAGVPVSVTDRLDGLPVGASLGRTVYRLVQEGLTNAGKHAAGAPVSLLLDRAAGGELHVLLSNPLPAPTRTAIPGAGSGLIGLAERVDLLDGRLRHGVHGDPRTGLTFDLEAWLPWPASAEPAAQESVAEPAVRESVAESAVRESVAESAVRDPIFDEPVREPAVVGPAERESAVREDAGPERGGRETAARTGVWEDAVRPGGGGQDDGRRGGGREGAGRGVAGN